MWLVCEVWFRILKRVRSHGAHAGAGRVRSDSGWCSLERVSMKKVFSSSNSARLPMSHRHGFARRTPHRQSTCHRLSASSRIYSILHGWWMVRRQSAPEGHGTCFRRSTVRCLKIVAPSAALHRDPQCVSGYRTLGFQISFDQED